MALDGFKATLYNSTKVPVCDIPDDCIPDVTINHMEVSTMNLKIPSLTMNNGKVTENIIYNRFKGLNQQIVINNPDCRFVVTSCSEEEKAFKGEDGRLIKYKLKTIGCEGYEKSNLGTLILEEDIVRQLYNDGTSTDVSEGLIDGYFLKDNPYWEIGYVSDGAKFEIGTAPITFKDTISGAIKKTKMTRGVLLWEKDFTKLNPQENSCVDIKIVYKNVTTKDNATGKAQIVETDYTHELYNIYCSVKHIKAIYLKTDEGIYSIKYEILLGDGRTIYKTQQFAYCDNMDLDIESVDMSYQTGQIEENGLLKYRIFEEGEYDWYDFLTKTVSEAYGVIFKFDNVKKKIYIYSEEEVGDLRLQFSYENYVKAINRKIVADDVVSDLIVQSENCSIIESNPFCSEHIYDYSYFIKNNIMSPNLQIAWNRYLLAIENVAVDKSSILEELDTLNRQLIQLESQRTAIDEQTRLLQVTRTEFQANKTAETPYTNEIKELSVEINNNMREFKELTLQIQRVNDEIDARKSELQRLLRTLDKKTVKDNDGYIFNDNLLEELQDLTITKSITDDTYLDSKAMYDYYVKDLRDKNSNPIEITIDSVGFDKHVKCAKGKYWSDYLKCGDYAYLVDADGLDEEDKKLRIISYQFSPKDKKINSITFSNRPTKTTSYSKVSGIASKVNTVSNYTYSYKNIWKESTNINNFVNKMLTDGLNGAVTPIKNHSNRVKYDMTEAGIYVMDGEDENKQLYIGTSMICFTNDSWLTGDACLTSDGLVGETIVGRILLGQQLYITSEDDSENAKSFYIGNIKGNHPDPDGNDFGIQICDRGATTERVFLGIENGVAKLRLVNDNISGGTSTETDSLTNKKVVLSDEGIQIPDNVYHADNVDGSHSLKIRYRVDDSTMEIRKAYLNIYRDKFRAYEKGAKSSGQVAGTSGASNVMTTGASSK